MISAAELAQLWRRHAAGLGLLGRSRGNADPEDLVQEAFVRLARQTQMPVDPLAWLARTVRNLAIDAARHEQRRRRREALFSEQRMVDEESPPIDRWRAEEAAQALEKLSALDRDIVIAHVWNEMTFRQIAEAFELSSSAASRKYLKALRQLKQELEPDVAKPADPTSTRCNVQSRG